MFLRRTRRRKKRIGLYSRRCGAANSVRLSDRAHRFAVCPAPFIIYIYNARENVYNNGEYHKLFGKRLKLYVGEPMELTKEGKGLNAEYLAGECKRFREVVKQLGK